MGSKQLLGLVAISVVIGLPAAVVIAQRGGQARVPDSVTADPVQHKVEFENDIVHVVRINYASGASAVTHSHPAHCLTFLTDGKLVLTLPDGGTVDATLKRGQVECNDAVVHSVRNVGGTPVEIVALEFKGRQTLKQ